MYRSTSKRAYTRSLVTETRNVYDAHEVLNIGTVDSCGIYTGSGDTFHLWGLHL